MKNLNHFDEQGKKELQKQCSDTFPERSVKIIVAKPRLSLPDNVMVFQSFAYLAAIKLKASTIRVLMFLLGSTEYENYIQVDILTLSEKLNLSEVTIVSALKELKENNIVLKVTNGMDRRRHDYFVNPTSAWRGNSFARQTLMQKIDKNQMKLFDGTQQIPAQFDDSVKKEEK